MNIVLHGRSGNEFLFPGTNASDSHSRITELDFSRLFPGMIAPDSHSRIVGMDLFIPFRLPIFGNDFLFHSCSQSLEMSYFLAVPQFWGMFLFNFLPIPELLERKYSFNSKKSFSLIPVTGGGGG